MVVALPLGLVVGAILGLTGAGGGILTGLLGVGGGFLIVPTLQRSSDIILHGIVATSLAVLVAAGLVAKAVHTIGLFS